jgi:DNA-binding NtrC family response regulator
VPKLAKILIVDDLIDYLQSLTNALESDFDIISAASLSEAKEKLNVNIDLILSDIRLNESDPDNKDGIALLEWSKKNFPEIPVVLMTVYRDFEIAVDGCSQVYEKANKHIGIERDVKRGLKRMRCYSIDKVSLCDILENLKCEPQ